MLAAVRPAAVVAGIASPLVAAALLVVVGVGSKTDAPSATLLARGKALYAQHCASCHGANLEGQPNWQTPLPSGRLAAPPHDASGHTWHHPDEILLRITKLGPAAVVGGGYESDMPGFGELLSEEEIRAVIQYIKSTWPDRERLYQEEMNRRRESGKNSEK